MKAEWRKFRERLDNGVDEAELGNTVWEGSELSLDDSYGCRSDSAISDTGIPLNLQKTIAVLTHNTLKMKRYNKAISGTEDYDCTNHITAIMVADEDVKG